MKSHHCESLNLLINCEEVYRQTIVEYDYATSIGKNFTLEATAYAGDNDIYYAITNIPIEYFEKSGLSRDKACKVVAKMLSHSWASFAKVQGNRKVSIPTLLMLFFSKIDFPQVRITDIASFKDEQHIGCTTLFYCTNSQQFYSVKEMANKLPFDCYEKHTVPYFMYRGSGNIKVNIGYCTAFQTKTDDGVYLYVNAEAITCALTNRNVKYQNFFKKTILSRPYILIRVDSDTADRIFEGGISKSLITSQPRSLMFFQTEEQVIEFAKKQGIVKHISFV